MQEWTGPGDMTSPEAMVLDSVLANVSAGPKDGPRRTMDEFLSAPKAGRQPQAIARMQTQSKPQRAARRPAWGMV